jgi:hypothetical protein
MQVSSFGKWLILALQTATHEIVRYGIFLLVLASEVIVVSQFSETLNQNCASALVIQSR